MLFLSLRRETNLNLLTIDQLHFCVVLENYKKGLFLNNLYV